MFVVGAVYLFISLSAFTGATGSWRVAAPMPIGRTEVAAVSLAGKSYVIGGGAKPGASRSSLNEVFDPDR